MKMFVVNSKTVPEVYYIPDKVVMVKAYHKKTDELVSICYKDVVTKNHIAFVDLVNKVIYLEAGAFYSDMYQLTKEFPSFGVCKCDVLKCKKDMKLVRYRCFGG